MVDVTRLTESELIKLKELTDKSRKLLHLSCAHRKTCTDCQWQHLCVYYRDLWLIANKELKGRAY